MIAEIPLRRKIAWSALLVFVGVAAGLLLSTAAIIQKFMIILAVLPLLAAVDIVLQKSRRGLLFWIRACGFEICSVFGVALATSYVLDITARL